MAGDTLSADTIARISMLIIFPITSTFLFNELVAVDAKKSCKRCDCFAVDGRAVDGLPIQAAAVQRIADALGVNVMDFLDPPAQK